MSKRDYEEPISDLETAIQKHQDSADRAHAENAEAIASLHEALDRLGEHAKVGLEANGRLNEETLAAVQAMRNLADAQISKEREAEGRLESARTRIQELERDLQENETLRARLEVAEGEIRKLTQELQDRDASVTKAKKIRDRMVKVEKAFEAQTQAVEAGNAAKRRVAELDTELNALKDRIRSEQERTKEQESEIDQLKSTELELRAELETAQLQLAVNESNSDEFSEETTALESEIVELRKVFELASTQLAEADEDIAKTRQHAEQLEAELAAQKTALESAEQSAASLEEIHENESAQSDSLREQAATADRLASELAAQKGAREDAEKHTAVLEEAAKEVSAEMESLRLRAADAEELARSREEALDAALESLDEVREAASRIANVSSKRSASKKAETEAPQETDESSHSARQSRLSDGRKRMGEILVEAGVISMSQLDEALSHQEEKSPDERLGAVVVELGMTDEIAVAKAIAQQMNVDFIHLDQSCVDREAAHRITGRVAEMHTCIPIHEKNGHLILAMANPLDLIAIEDVERASELPVRPVVATAGDLALCISCIYAKVSQDA